MRAGESVILDKLASHVVYCPQPHTKSNAATFKAEMDVIIILMGFRVRVSVSDRVRVRLKSGNHNVQQFINFDGLTSSSILRLPSPLLLCASSCLFSTLRRPLFARFSTLGACRCSRRAPAGRSCLLRRALALAAARPCRRYLRHGCRFCESPIEPSMTR